jgi:phosphoribosylformimino-5-aminoimidazole carboxamide ribonucleotide (ProFAR) isomerase
VITDLLLGLGFNDCFRIFHDHVREKYNAEPGYITMNVPKLLDVLDGLGIDNPIVCANINKIGFRMCGGIDLYEKTIATRRFRPVAMSVLASGAIAPREGIEYVCKQSRVESIVVGASGRGNIRQTKALIDELSVQLPV